MESNKVKNMTDDLERDGYLFMRGFFSHEIMDKAKEEVETYYDTYGKSKNGIWNPKFMDINTTTGKAAFNGLLDVYAECPTLDLIFEKLLTDPIFSQALKKIAGNIKIRGYNVQKFTGEYDPRPTLGPAPINHEWHRDSPGEMNIGVMITDFNEGDNGATALIRGSHKYPFCPRKNCLFGPPYNFGKGLNIFLRYSFFNRLLAKKVLKNATGAYGKKGDVYLFLNDTWHGREPNLHGMKGIRMMIGCFPNDIPFPDKVEPVSDKILAKMPPTAQRVLRPQPINKDNSTLIHKIIRAQPQPTIFDLFYWARVERKIGDLISANVHRYFRFKEKMKSR